MRIAGLAATMGYFMGEICFLRDELNNPVLTSPELQAGLKAAISKHVDYYRRISVSRPYVVAVMSDPRAKNLYQWAVDNEVVGDEEDEGIKTRAESIFRDVFKEYQATIGPVPVAPVVPVRRTRRSPMNTDTTPVDELTAWSSLKPPLNMEDDPRLFFRTPSNRETFRTVAAMNDDYGHMPASSAEVERSFSRY
jgi:hypothetical protein